METSLLYTFLSIVFFLIVFKLSTKPKHKLPPSPRFKLPLLGHIYIFKSPLHRTFHQLSKKFGHIFSLRFGNRLVVVVSSSELVEQCFTKNDIILANRPQRIINKYIGYNYTALTSSPYGEHWRNLRRLTTIEVFSSTRLNKFMSSRHDELKIQLRKLFKKSQQDFAKVELRPVFSEFAFNNIMRMVSGKRYIGVDNEEAKQFRDLMDAVAKMSGISNPGDFFPVLKWIDYKGFEKKLASVTTKMDLFLQSLIDEHKGNKSANTMIDHLLSLQESQPEYYSDEIIKGLIIVMLLAGTDTTAVTLEWAMSCLLNHPETLEKARVELDNIVGNERLVEESDLPNLPYLQSIISETFRLLPTAPLLSPHEASSDCNIGGYDIPKGAILIVNAWTIHRDPMTWESPTSFKPERFENKEVAPTKLIPFGMGRRSCPGSGLAQYEIGLALGSLLQCFEWQRVDEAKIELTEGSGLTMPKAIPLEAMCKPRNVLHKILSRDD